MVVIFLLSCLISGLLGLVQPTPLQAATYYLSPGGQDTNPGTSASPWQTFQKAADMVLAGDTVLIRDGVYNGGIELTTPGTASQPIVFRALGTSAVINGSGGETDAFLISGIDLNPQWWLGGDMYVSLEGLTIKNANRAGVRISCAHHVTVKNCILDHNGRWGIFTDYANYSRLEGNECSYSQVEHGIYVSNSSDYPVIRRNRVHHNAACGIQINADPAMAEGDGITTGALVEQNVVYENGSRGGAAVNLASVRNSTIRNNLLYHNYAGGISGWGDGNGPAWGCKNDAFYNNTIYFRPGQGRWAISLKEGSTGARIGNNILMGGGRGAFEYDDPQILTGLRMDYNLFYRAASATMVTWEDTGTYSLGQWRSFSQQDLYSLSAVPTAVFTDYLQTDFSLKPDSPALNAGDPASSSNDRDKTRNDLGAFGGPASPGVQYAFRYAYAGGDYYTGLVYGPAAKYNLTFLKTVTDENGLPGTYSITAITPGYDYYLKGQVCVTDYYNEEDKTTYVPRNNLSPLGVGYLASERGYILQANNPTYFFGKGYYEADLSGTYDRYYFRYVYGNADYYSGFFYAAQEKGYYVGWKQNSLNETGLTGYYEITGMSYRNTAASNYGKVYLSSYYDGDATQKSYTPINSTLPQGSAYLGRESGFIVQATIPAYQFGSGYYEADGP